MKPITKDLTRVNYTRGNAGRKYIVIHYTGNITDTAKGNANYFRDTNRGASAHYFVDKNAIYQVVSDEDTAWAVGRNFGSNNLFGRCNNNNSISIEMCSDGGRIAPETLQNTIDLTKHLMIKYNIPASNVVRHYDVCSKHCPGWSGWLPPNDALWLDFKNKIQKDDTKIVSQKGEAEMQCTFEIDNKGVTYWFDGQQIHTLTHPDQLVILQKIYEDNNGKKMPHYNWSSKAPWHVRLKQAIDGKNPKKF